MKATTEQVATFLAALEAMPGRIAEATTGRTKERLAERGGARAWSAVDVLAHLRACAELWGGSVEAMLAAREPVLPDIDERRWAKSRGYADLPFAASLDAFTERRSDLVGILRPLTIESWERLGIIGGRRHTVFTQVRRTAKHEAEHLRQIELIVVEPI